MRVRLHVHTFRKLLVQETDETKRQMLFLSLAGEEATLKTLLRELSAKCGREPASIARCSVRRPAAGEAAVSDAARRTQIEKMMHIDGGRAYWRDSGVQREYGEVLARLSGEAPPLAPAPAAPEAVPTSTPAEAPPQEV